MTDFRIENPLSGGASATGVTADSTIPDNEIVRGDGGSRGVQGSGITIADGASGTLSGTNTGDQTSIVGITGSMAQFDTAVNDGNIVYQGQALGTPASGTATNLTGTASGLTAGTVTTNANLTGDVTSVGNATTIGAGKVTEAMQVLANNSTNNVSTSKHGYAPILPNDATKYLDGTGAYTVPAGGGGVSSISKNGSAQLTGDVTLTGGTNVTLTQSGQDISIAASSAGTNEGSHIPGVAFTGVSYKQVIGSNLSTGDNDLYTVPASKRAMVFGIGLYNQSAGTIAWYPEIKVSGTYYRIGGTNSISTGGESSDNTVGYPILEPGEIIAINTATTNGLNVFLQVMVFDNTVPCYSPKVLTLSNGDNTVYTVPGGKSAMLLDRSYTPFNSTGKLFIANVSGGTRATIWYVVPSGQSIGVNYQAGASTNVANNGRGTRSFPASLGAGDFIAINTDSGAGTQTAWVNVAEI